MEDQGHSLYKLPSRKVLELGDSCAHWSMFSEVGACCSGPVTLCLCLQTALHLAVHLDQPGTVRALVLKGASRVLQDRHGDTALHVACQRQHLACARCLLEGRPEPGRGPPHCLDLQLQNWQGTGSLRTCGIRRGQETKTLLSGKGDHGLSIDIPSVLNT